MSQMTRSSTRPLSEVARHVVRPSGIVSTGWPAVAYWLRKLGIGFDGWQQGASKLILAKRADGLYASTVGGVFMSLPRQVGKTYMIAGLIFALCLLHPKLTVLWTAQLLKTSGETFRTFRALAKRRSIAPFIESVRVGSGDWVVEFKNGSRIMLGAREGEFGRGFSEVDVIVLDEAQILDDKTLDAMIPAANASKVPAGALVLYMGTPPKPTDRSEVFSRARAAALSGESDDLLYIECSAKADVDPRKWPPGYVDFDAIAEANPSYPDRTPRASILRMAKQLSRESLRREGLGIWDDGGGAKRTIPAALWGSRIDAAPATGKLAVGVKFSQDGLRVAAAIARKGDAAHLEVLGVWPTAVGVAKLSGWLGKRWREFSTITIDGKSGQGVLRQALLDAGVADKAINLPSVADVQTAHAMTLTAVEDGTLTHGNQAGLNAAVAVATKRNIGTAGGWGWEAIGEGDVLPLEAATFALFGVATSKTTNFKTSAPRRLY